MLASFDIVKKLLVGHGGRSLWLLVGNLILPSVNQFSQLFAFITSLQGIRVVSNGGSSGAEIFTFCIVIFFLFVFASLVKLVLVKLQLGLRLVIFRRIRELLALKFIGLRDLEGDEFTAEFKHVKSRENVAVLGGARAVFQLVQFVSGALLVFLLNCFIIVFVPWVGLFVLILGLSGFWIMRKSISKHRQFPGKVKKRKEVTTLGNQLSNRSFDLDSAKVAYVNNALDSSEVSSLAERKNRTQVLEIASGAAIGLVMVVALLSFAQGGFVDWDPVWILILIFSLRILLIKSKEMVNQLAAVLSEREILKYLTTN